MPEPAIVDTNLLVYLYDPKAGEKHERSIQVVNRLVELRLGVLTPQILAEFFVAVTRRIPDPLSVVQARQTVQNYVDSCHVLNHTGQIVLEAVRGVAEHQLQYWDAQIWASARLNRIRYVLTEDTPSPARIEGVQYLNPFDKDFDLGFWSLE